jgi:hypothetical protein
MALKATDTTENMGRQVYTDGALMNPCDVKGESGNGEGKCGL